MKSKPSGPSPRVAEHYHEREKFKKLKKRLKKPCCDKCKQEKCKCK